MELWILYSILAWLTMWVVGYFQKIQAEEKFVNTDAFIFYNFFFSFVYSIFWLTFFWNGIIFWWENVVYGFLIVLSYHFILKFRIKSLKYVNTSTYFINYRIFSSILLVILWQLLFWETITINEYLWIILWFVIFYLLLEKKEKWEKESDFRKWIIFIFYCVILVSFLQILAKDFMISWFDPYSLLFFQWIFWILVSCIVNIKKWHKRMVYIRNSKSLLFLWANGLFLYASAIFNNFALIEWDVAIVYKIMSYSIFIPIILSIIFYWEKLTPKKFFAFILTIISIALFV